VAPEGVARLYCADRSLAAIALLEGTGYRRWRCASGTDAPWRGEAQLAGPSDCNSLWGKASRMRRPIRGSAFSQASICPSADKEGVAPIRRGVSRELDDARHRVRTIVVLPWAVVHAVASSIAPPPLKPAKLAQERLVLGEFDRPGVHARDVRDGALLDRLRIPFLHCGACYPGWQLVEGDAGSWTTETPPGGARTTWKT